MDQTFWGVVSAAAGRLGTCFVFFEIPFPLPLALCIWFTIRWPWKKYQNHVLKTVSCKAYFQSEHQARSLLRPEKS